MELTLRLKSVSTKRTIARKQLSLMELKMLAFKPLLYTIFPDKILRKPKWINKS